MDKFDYLTNPDNYGSLTHSQITELYEKLLEFNKTKEMKTTDWIEKFKSDVIGKYYTLESNSFIISDVFNIEIISYSNTFCDIICTVKCHRVSKDDCDSDDRIIPKVTYEVTLDGIIEIR